MSATYTQDELIPSSQLVKNFGSYLAKVSSNEVEKIGILKNNKLDAVMISGDMYEMFQEFIEHAEVYNEIKERISNPEIVSGDDMLQKFGLSVK